MGAKSRSNWNMGLKECPAPKECMCILCKRRRKNGKDELEERKQQKQDS